MTEQNSEMRKEDILRNIKENYEQLEKSIVEQLKMHHKLHGVTIGTQREELWKQMFEMVIPKKFVIEHSIFIIDAHEGVSHEVDLAVIDDMYTPYIFKYGKLKFVPIEAVAVVIECKSTNADSNSETINKWLESICSLKTDEHSICRLATKCSTDAPNTQKATKPITILCALDEVYSKYNERFDFVITAKTHLNKLEVHVDKNRSLQEWWVRLCSPTQVQQNSYLEEITLEKFEIRNDEGGASIITDAELSVKSIIDAH